MLKWIVNIIRNRSNSKAISQIEYRDKLIKQIKKREEIFDKFGYEAWVSQMKKDHPDITSDNIVWEVNK